jgi:hypothetical protein
MWTFEPHVALKIYRGWLAELDIPVVMNQRLDRNGGVAMTRSIPWNILSIRMESGEVFQGKMFIDATYEGDLMAAAGVQYTIGREANSLYDETLNGVQTARATHHQFARGVDPYITPGDPTSGLLSFIEPDPPEPDGAGDHRLQAYCFRMCMTDHWDNRIAWQKPDGYQAQWYELLLRNFEAGESRVPLSIGPMPNRKTDANNNFGFSTDFIGQNYDYPHATYEQRRQIVAKHRLYQQGLMWTLANHPRVPQSIRDEVARWGMCKDEFIDGHGWQEQLYIREARRMVGDLVMTQHHCQCRQIADDPVGLAAYTMDSHHVRRHLDPDGFVRNEGDVQVRGFPPYPIGYRAIVPRADQCSNLLVPVCLSASHIAFGSIRMEPVFMVLGQSAGTAATHSIDQHVPVQHIDPLQLRQQLLADGMILEWNPSLDSSSHRSVDAKGLQGIVLDDNAAKMQGFDSFSSSVTTFVGKGYRHDGDTDKGNQTAIFNLKLPESGQYEIRISYSPHPNRATNVPVKIQHTAGEATILVNQRNPPAINSLFHSLGKYRFESGREYEIHISNNDTDGHVIVDAIQAVKI